MRPTVNILVNISGNDVACSNPAGDSNFVLLEAGDYLVWKDSQQMGGNSISGISYPVLIPETGSLEASKLFLADASLGQLRQVVLAGTSLSNGGGNKRYVCCAWFSGATSTVPYLEAYDNNAHVTSESAPLGSGVPADSCFKAIATTNAAPGLATWTGTALSGATSRIALDTGALTAAKFLYWNMKQIITSTMVSWSSEDWYNADIVFAIHFTYA